MPETPEQRARRKIDADLTAAGWLVHDLKDKSLNCTDSLPPPDMLAAEIADDLEAALAQFTKIAARLSRSPEP